jgi:hypothetical protein
MNASALAAAAKHTYLVAFANRVKAVICRMESWRAHVPTAMAAIKLLIGGCHRVIGHEFFMPRVTG